MSQEEENQEEDLQENKLEDLQENKLEEVQEEENKLDKKNIYKSISSALVYLTFVLAFPFVYQYVVEKVMAAYDFRWAVIAGVWLILVGASMSVANYFSESCKPKQRFIIRGAVIIIILADILISWFGYRWFSMTLFLCTAISLSDFLVLIAPVIRNNKLKIIN